MMISLLRVAPMILWRNLQNLLKSKSKRCRTPTLLQMEVVECGAAALGIILSYYGRIVPLTELRQACGVSRDGVSALNILKAARNYRLTAKSFKTNLAALSQLKFPFIVFWQFNHFLVVEGFGKQRVYLNDPATGRRTVSLEEFSSAYTGVVLALEPSSEFLQGGRKPSTILALWSRLRGSIGALIYCVLAGFLLVIPGLAIPAFSQVFIDNVLIEHRHEWLRPLILGMIFTAGLNGFLTLLQLQFLRQLKIKLSVAMESQFLWHILRLPMSFYDQRFAGEISSRVQLNYSIANMLSGKLATTVIATASIFLYVGVMLQYDVVLTLIAIAFVAVNLAALQWVRGRRVDANIKLLQEHGKVSGVAISGLQSMETLKASGLESDFFSRWAGYYAKAINTRQELETTNQTLGVLPDFLSAIASMLLLAIGGLRVMDGTMSIGMLIAFLGMMQNFFQPISNLVNLGSDLQEMEGNLTRLDDVLRNPIDSQLQERGRGEWEQRGRGAEEAGGDMRVNSSSSPLSSSSLNPFSKLRGYVELDNVTFGYSKIAPPLIENFSLSLQPGQRVALVGGSGSGKSTIAKLLCGLYQPWQGEILFDGKPKEQISRQVLANSISAVEQEILLFAGSVRDNLTLWDTTIPESHLVRACQDAAVHDVILSLPGGYSADLLEGATNLSGGQRQRLEIARALVNNPSILVMDEATSALDAETEKNVTRNLRLRGCTCIIIAHRLSTIRDCDEIIVLDRGQIVQRGTHEELRQIEGLYLQLIRSEGDEEAGEQGRRGAGEQGRSSSKSFPFAPLPLCPSAPLPLLGECYRFQGNQSLLLSDPQTIWVVKSGYLALFAIALNNGIPEGSRRYLFSSTAGQAMFGTASSLDSEQHQILAVFFEETELLKVSRTELNRLFADTNSEAVAFIEGWIYQLGSVIAGITTPTTPLLPQGIQYYSLAKNQIFQPPGHVSWVQILQGRAKWMGFGDLLLTPVSGILPLHPNMWLEASDTVELKTVSTLEISDVNSLLGGLSQLQTYFLNCIELLQRQEMNAELLRFEARESLERQVMQETLAELASVLPQPKLNRLSSSLEFSISIDANHPDRALLVAAGAVGRALGVEIRPPAASEDPKRVQDPVEAIARASHIRVRRIQLRDNWWQKDCGPMLAFTLQDNLPVALLPISDTRYQLYAPWQQKRVSVDARIAAALAPTGYVFYRPLPNKPLKTFDLLQFALQGHSKELIVIVVMGITISLLGMLTPQATAILIDKAIPDANRGLLSQLVVGLLAAAFGGMLFQLALGFATIRLETFADSATEAAVWDRLLNLKATFFRSFSVGDLNSRVTAISQIRQRLGNTVFKTIFSSMFSLLNLGLLFYYSIYLALIACVVALINIAVTIISGMLIVRKVRPLLEQEGQIFGVMVQLINGVAKLRVAKAEARAFAYWGKKYTHQLKLMLSTQGIEDSLAVINQVLPVLTTAAIFWFATTLIGQSQTPGATSLSTGTFLAFNVAFGTFIHGVTNLSSTVVEVLQVLPLWQRAQPILQGELEINSSQADPGRLSGKLVADRVSFRYRDDGPLTLDDVSIHAQPGEFIAIVGPSGSGKSTFLRLLLGFEFPKAGSIYYDGQDLASVDVHAVRRQLGVVIQNSRLMSASIFENIASGAVLTMDEAWQAAQMAGFADDVAAMPMQMHTVVSEGGSNLSGGQRQRLLIARALALKPRILLFDEATSALDNRTQAIVSQSLEQLKVTRIAIAHRLSTIQNADRIYVLQAGKIVQQGSFTDLANQPGLFAQLMLRQML
ncbi:MAG: NHLP family bacteriocin export ABC transporter peptidase/permease/ATPase subunit [Nostoc sp. EfeVER01]|uniref:NHLP family bacteriocin export ABC transporter peptidase/permease/ATPase subunit n=1 Tax=unclassified Nostoc TaxID=2593658 RepID=UPI002AD25D69|nr:MULTISPECIES: NHLP family bacteriocin export ABC transporter peptidase/permease/ATPase subunit [unclassified Nostoc]MDZ7944060.1 NHLP family bacteriocin export ABC transporter peptidase/permease/ATPase subunit [Nostoc sp. EfeVER01]MDZ7993932.1 NHLP family bacteriocin export ABC transporter peptidase/permease/ATPase subunit [Nostoc sp. EspVER01]